MGCDLVGERIALLEDLRTLQTEGRMAWRREVTPAANNTTTTTTTATTTKTSTDGTFDVTFLPYYCR